MLAIGVWALVLALITSVITSLGLFCGVQPRMTLSSGPTDDPLGPQPFSATTPVFVVALNAPTTAVGVLSVTGFHNHAAVAGDRASQLPVITTR